MSAADLGSMRIPTMDDRTTIDQLKKNLRALVDTGKIISAEIKRLEEQRENKWKIKT